MQQGTLVVVDTLKLGLVTLWITHNHCGFLPRFTLIERSNHPGNVTSLRCSGIDGHQKRAVRHLNNRIAAARTSKCFRARDTDLRPRFAEIVGAKNNIPYDCRHQAVFHAVGKDLLGSELMSLSRRHDVESNKPKKKNAALQHG